MLSFLSLRKLILPLLVVLSVALAGYAVYRAGGANERAKQVENQLQQIERITDAINEGRREIRRVNPDGNADSARQWLRNRQQNN